MKQIKLTGSGTGASYETPRLKMIEMLSRSNFLEDLSAIAAFHEAFEEDDDVVW